MIQKDSPQARSVCFDPGRLTEIFDLDSAAIREVLDEAVSSLLELHSKLTGQLLARNREASIALVHEMAGVSGNVGADELCTISGAILQLLRKAGAALTEVPEDDLQAALGRFVAAARLY